VERDLTILPAEEDIDEIGASLEPGSATAVLVWESSWPASFGSAMRTAGGESLGNVLDPGPLALIAAAEVDRAHGDERSMKMGLFRERGDRPRPRVHGPVT
jgi:hypothetical protein